MLLQTRPIGVSIAVIFFFGLSILGWFSGLTPFTCCKRALTGAFAAYVMTALAIKAINLILINAMINSQVNQQKEEASAPAN